MVHGDCFAFKAVPLKHFLRVQALCQALYQIQWGPEMTRTKIQVLLWGFFVSGWSMGVKITKMDLKKKVTRQILDSDLREKRVPFPPMHITL